MFLKITAGQTQRSIPLKVQDSTSTTGALLSGLLWNTAGLTARWRREGDSTHTTLTLANATLGSWTDGGFIADSIQAGHYELGLSNAMIAAGARWVEIVIFGAANMVPVAILIELDVVNYQTDAFGALKPTTSGRTLDVSAGGEAGIDLANIGSPTTVVNLSGLTIKTATDIETDTQDIQTRLPAALLGGRMDVSVGAYQSGLVPLQPTVAGRTLDVSVGGEAGVDLANVGSPTTVLNLTGLTIKSATDVETDTQDIQTRLPAALNGGRMEASVGAYQTGLAPLQPTVAGRTLDVTLTGAAGIDWSNVENPTHANVLSATSIGGINGVTFPDDFDKLVIEPTGHVVSSVDKINNNTITASSIQGGAITAAKFAAGAIDANALNADAATEIATAVAGIEVLTRLASMIESNGAGSFRFTTIALSLAPTGGGGGGTDWTTNEKAAIRGILGFDSSGNLVVPSSGALYTITTQTASLFKYGDTQRWNSPSNQIDVIITKVT